MTSLMTLPNYMTGFLYELGPSSGVYSFVSYPSTISPTQRSKFRNESASNIMHDRRVVRGNTYAKKVPMRNVVTATNDTREQRLRDAERRQQWKKYVLPNLDGRVRSTTGYGKVRSPEEEKSSSSTSTQLMPETKQLSAQVRVRKRPSTLSRFSPKSRNRRQHSQTQTEKWPDDEIRIKTSEIHVGVQTDHPHPLNLPVFTIEGEKSDKVNKSTQISSDDLDFNVFDDEIIENLVEKILKYGFLEVIHEEELAAMTKETISSQEKSLLLLCT